MDQKPWGQLKDLRKKEQRQHPKILRCCERPILREVSDEISDGDGDGDGVDDNDDGEAPITCIKSFPFHPWIHLLLTSSVFFFRSFPLRFRFFFLLSLKELALTFLLLLLNFLFELLVCNFTHIYFAYIKLCRGCYYI